MALYGVRDRSSNAAINKSAPFNWRRGIFRMWLLMSAAWIMAWVIDLIIWTVRFGMEMRDVTVVPILLFGPPVALLIFGLGIGWAFRGFKVEGACKDTTSAIRRPHHGR